MILTQGNKTCYLLAECSSWIAVVFDMSIFILLECRHCQKTPI